MPSGVSPPPGVPPGPGPPAPEGAPNLKSSYLAHQGRGPPPSMSGRRGHAWRYLPSKAPPAPGRGRCAPSSPTVGPSSELASTPNHPIRPPMAGRPPLDAGAKGACLQLSPVESPPAPRPGKACPFDPPSWPTSSPPAKPSSELASTHNPQNAHCPSGKTPGAMPPPRCCLPVPMVSEPTGQQTCRSDTGPRPAVRLPPPSARRCRNN